MWLVPEAQLGNFERGVGVGIFVIRRMRGIFVIARMR